MRLAFEMLSVVAALRRVPGAVRLRRALARLQYGITLLVARRRNYLYTQFCRIPTQLDVLAGPVWDTLRPVDTGSDLRIIVFGCSIGAETYSIASTLRYRRPGRGFTIECFDIEPSVIARGVAARYTREEVTHNEHLPPGFVDRTFDPRDGDLIVKPEIKAGITFALGNVLDAALANGLGRADVVVAQNFLYHLSRPDAERAFHHLVGLLKPQAALLVDGADLDIRTRLTAEAGLTPCPLALEEIHAEARVQRGYAWPGTYWGLEPFDGARRDALRRYATIFLRESPRER